MNTLSAAERPFMPVLTTRVGCVVRRSGDCRPSVKLLPTCAYCTSTSRRSLNTHWLPNLNVGFGPVFHRYFPKLLSTAFCGVVVSIGLRSLAPRALRSFLLKLL